MILSVQSEKKIHRERRTVNIIQDVSIISSYHNTSDYTMLCTCYTKILSSMSYRPEPSTAAQKLQYIARAMEYASRKYWRYAYSITSTAAKTSIFHTSSIIIIIKSIAKYSIIFAAQHTHTKILCTPSILCTDTYFGIVRNSLQYYI